jgi:hypothetical protein
MIRVPPLPSRLNAISMPSARSDVWWRCGFGGIDFIARFCVSTVSIGRTAELTQSRTA